MIRVNKPITQCFGNIQVGTVFMTKGDHLVIKVTELDGVYLEGGMAGETCRLNGSEEVLLVKLTSARLVYRDEKQI